MNKEMARGAADLEVPVAVYLRVEPGSQIFALAEVADITEVGVLEEVEICQRGEAHHL